MAVCLFTAIDYFEAAYFNLVPLFFLPSKHKTIAVVRNLSCLPLSPVSVSYEMIGERERRKEEKRTDLISIGVGLLFGEWRSDQILGNALQIDIVARENE